MNYRYYSTQRPIMPGSYPNPEGNGIVTVYNFDNKTYCCSPRECCEERGDTLNSAAGNDFDGEPDCFMSAHIAVEYIGEEEQE